MKNYTQDASQKQEISCKSGSLGGAHNRLTEFTPASLPANLADSLPDPDTIAPVVDNVGMSVLFGSMSEFYRFCDIVEADTGQKLLPRKLDDVLEWYCPIYDVYLVPPVKDISHRYGDLHFQPNAANLRQVQIWLEKFFEWRKRINDTLVTLNMIELAFDFPCQDNQTACMLADQFARSLWPRYARCTYAVMVTGEKKKASDGAVNGTQTIYIQSGKLEDAGKSSDDLDQNLDANKHTKIYPKELDRQYLRVEITLTEYLAKNLMEDSCYQDFTKLLDIASSKQFSDYYIFRQANVDKFNKDFMERYGFSTKIVLLNRPDNTMPFVDQLRLMLAVNKKLDKKLKVQNYFKDIPFRQAMSEPLPDNFEISLRSAKHGKEADTEHKQKQNQVALPCSGATLQPLPSSECAPLPNADMPQNRAKMPLHSTQTKIPSAGKGAREKCVRREARASCEAQAPHSATSAKATGNMRANC